MLISIETFNKYTGVFGDALAEQYIKSAQEIVTNYLGYDPEQAERTITVNGSGNYQLDIGCRPINEILTVSLNGTEKDLNNFYTAANFILMKRGSFEEGAQNWTCVVNAGWTEETLPEVIKGTILQIAALRQIESNQNVGVTSKAFGDSGTRVFQNTRNYTPYLMNISKYKVL